MAAVGLLSEMIGVNTAKLSKAETIILEAELFIRIWQEVKEVFRVSYKNYFQLMKFDEEMENKMLESEFLRLVINDILSSGDYTLEGLALYSGFHEDVIHEVACGKNTSPSVTLYRRMIELHRTIRQDLYLAITKKIVTEQLAVAS